MRVFSIPVEKTYDFSALCDFFRKKVWSKSTSFIKKIVCREKTSPFRFLSTRKTDREKNSIFPERKIIQFFSQNLDFLMFRIKIKAVFESLGYLLSIFGTVNLIKIFPNSVLSHIQMLLFLSLKRCADLDRSGLFYLAH